MGCCHSLLRATVKRLKGAYFRRQLRRAAIKWGGRFRLKEHGYVLDCKELRSKFYLPYYRSEYVQQKIISTRNYYEYDNLHYITTVVQRGLVGQRIKDGVVLDIGSNIGNHTLYFLLECGAGMVHCFEPMQEVFSILQKNIEINSLQDKVQLHHAGVGAKSSKAALQSFDVRNMGSTRFDYNEKGDVEIVAIDDLQIEQPVVFVKIDVEGFELEVVKGMMNTIRRWLPYMMIEIGEENFDEMNGILSSLGYWYINIDKGEDFLYIPSVV